VAQPRDRGGDLVARFAHSQSKALSTKAVGVGGPELGVATTRGGKAARTWLAVDGVAFGLTAELTDGQREVTFPDVVPNGFSIAVNADGSAQALTPTGELASDIKAPWARDAKGTSLRTWYEARGQDLVQHVDTKGAVYPIIADPWVTTGFWYTIPVFYVEFSWSETWAIHNALKSSVGDAIDKACGLIPNKVYKAACKLILGVFKTDVKNTVKAAIAAKKCYKVRLPPSGGAAFLPAYDSYYKTCKK
jgi:hypothetical protein